MSKGLFEIIIGMSTEHQLSIASIVQNNGKQKNLLNFEVKYISYWRYKLKIIKL